MSNTRNWPIIGAHGITIGGHHTFRDWSLVAEEIPVVSPPETKTEYVDIAGGSGLLDYTDALMGKAAYGNRTGSWSFLVLPDTSWAAAYTAIMAAIHGKRMNCVLDDDTSYYYTGRFFVNEWKSNRGYSRIVIDYNLEPYKNAVGDSTGELPDWLWNDLFENIIYYGNFKIEAGGVKRRNLINPTSDVIVPKFTCSSPVTATVNNINYPLPAGFTDDPGFPLYTGNNYVYFSSSVLTTVSVDYTLDQIL